MTDLPDVVSDELPPEPEQPKRRGKRTVAKGSYVIVETGAYMGMLARVDSIDEVAKSITVSLETGGDPFPLLWPGGVRLANNKELPEDAIFPEE